MDTKINGINSIEKKLDSILRPVNPEESYVSKLKLRLLSEPGISIEKPDYLYIVLLIGTFFFFGVFLVWLINRMFIRKSD